jgi:hypothetical protein
MQWRLTALCSVGDRAEARKSRWRAKFERLNQEAIDKRNPNIGLASEMLFLEALADREEFMSQLVRSTCPA